MALDVGEANHAAASVVCCLSCCLLACHLRSKQRIPCGQLRLHRSEFCSPDVLICSRAVLGNMRWRRCRCSRGRSRGRDCRRGRVRRPRRGCGHARWRGRSRAWPFMARGLIGWLRQLPVVAEWRGRSRLSDRLLAGFRLRRWSASAAHRHLLLPSFCAACALRGASGSPGRLGRLLRLACCSPSHQVVATSKWCARACQPYTCQPP
jgi:hypothetical protein